MKERPILFSGPMVRAILDGRKTQTRRVVKVRSKWAGDGDPYVSRGKVWKPARVDYSGYVECPYGQPGDRLWVRETWQCAVVSEAIKGIGYKATYDDERNWFKAKTGPEWDRLWDKHQDKWRPSIHMYRWASRITLEISAVRVERLQDIGEDDANAEGIESFMTCQTLWPARAKFAELWDHINANTHPWASNPWVWVIEFRTL